MTSYTNPTGTFTATVGPDSFTFDQPPSAVVAIDASDGLDTLNVDFAATSSAPVSVQITDNFNDGELWADIASGPYDPDILVWNVETINASGGAGDDHFSVTFGADTSGLSVSFDGRGGNNELTLDYSKSSLDSSFVADSTGLTSTLGQFANFEQFVVHSGSGDDTIKTGSANDQIWTGTGIDVVSAGAGDDQIYSQSSGGSVDGGDGIDYYDGDFTNTTTPLTITMGDTTQISNGITISNVEEITIGGGSGDDLFTVTKLQPQVGTLYGGGGHDTLAFTAAGATIGMQFHLDAYGGEIDGSIGSAGEAEGFQEFEAVDLTGTQYNDEFQISAVYTAKNSDITLDGGAGNDQLQADFSHFSGATSLIVAADQSITSNRGDFTSFESFTLSGGSGNDTFTTSSGNDTLSGGTGADHLDGGGGNDWIYSDQYQSDDDGAADVMSGGAGNDWFAAGFGDSISGGTGTDTLNYTASSGTTGITADFASLTAGGTISVAGGTLSGIETVPQIFATNYDDIISAGAGGSTIYANGGNDHVTGSASADTIYGGDGNDVLTGGGGADTLIDYSGDDTFIDTAAGFNGDIIDGFDVGDTIVITDASLDDFTYSLTGSQLTYTGGSLTLESSRSGHIAVNAAAGGGVAITVEPLQVFTNDQIADQLVNGYWDGDWHHFNVTQGGTITVNLTALTSNGQALARAALAEWTDVIGINFKEVMTGGQIVFDDNQDGAFTTSDWTDHVIRTSHVNIDANWLVDYGTALDSYSFQTYLHEIGHALGLGHSGDYNDTATFPDDALFANDGWSTTVMSYFDQYQTRYFSDLRFSNDYAVTPMSADVVAMQTLYGLSTATRTGDTTYGFHSTAGDPVFDASANPAVAYTIVDSGGNDTLDYSLWGYSQLIDLNPETFSNVVGQTGNMSIGRGTVIENAIGGSGSDTIIGNSASNVLTGNAGNDQLTGNGGDDTLYGDGGDDTMDGGAGADTLYGGAGNDTYVVHDGADVVIEASGLGVDTVISSISYTLGNNVEHLTFSGGADLTGSGNALDNILVGNRGENALYGNAGDDKLVGNAGNDTLDGGIGNDRMVGGTGDDTYYADAYNDAVIENADGGTDAVFSTADFKLRANVEDLTLAGSAEIWGYGNDLDNALTGNDATNKLFGLAGNDVIDGKGGIDRMFGGTGDDTYTVDNYSDHVLENAGEGTDTVFASVNYKLAANVENLTITGTADLWAYGNDGDNVLTGNSGANKLYGLTGNDTLNGGNGNDWLEGGAGQDHLTGGTGSDSFAFREGDFGGATAATADEITDFTHGEDHIRLNFVDADTTATGDQAFSFLSTAAFDDHAGELRYEQISGNTYVEGDTNGDGIADFMICIDGLHSLVGSDFVF